jgi:acetylornithine deacetylase/succinyl-diaminopimelate desuccinylase-like protein
MHWIRLLPLGLILFSQVCQSDPGTLGAEVRKFRQTREQQIVDDFIELLKIPNVASDQANILRNAEHIQSLLKTRRFQTRLLSVDDEAPPAVYAERNTVGARFTLVIYAHYDGQPAQAENWASPPWQPVMRDGLVEVGGQQVPAKAPFDPEWRLFARSAGDDKLPMIALIHALDALDQLGVEPSVNLKLFLDGEEEAGSPHMAETLKRYRELLAADLWLFCDGPMHPSRRLQISYGVRGVTGFDLTVYGPVRPLHSGHYGNWAPNPVSMLTRLMASMRGDDGQVLIPGFYDQVNEPTALELAAIAAIPGVDLSLRQELGLARTEGDARVEREILKPALNYRGIRAGEVGAAARNIIVPEATSSIGIRLVPGQQIDQVRKVVEAHIQNQGYYLVDESPDMETRRAHERVARIDWGGGYPAYRTPLEHPMAQALAGLMNELVQGDLIQAPTMGGSLPLYMIPEITGSPVIILPVANHDNNQHGKDENLRLQNLWDAIEIYAVTVAELGYRLEAETN